MGIKKYVANADNTITNAFKSNLSTRATGANAGAADILETFSIYGRQATSSAEISRILVKFPVTDITTDRTNGVIPASGSVSFYLRLFNAPHSKTVPSGSFTIVAEPISADWEEGFGLDLEEYKDVTNGNKGSNWIARKGEGLQEITKVTFSSDTLADYGAGSGANYIKIYNIKKRFNLWFNDGSGDSAPSVDGSEVEVDISSTSAAKASIAAQFHSVVNAQGNFSSNIDPTTSHIVYVTASTAGGATDSSVVGTLGGIALAVQQDGNNEIPWTKVGGDYITTANAAYPYRWFSQSFTSGLEDIEIDITQMVELWSAGTIDNYGLGVHLSGAFEPYFSTDFDPTYSGYIQNTTGSTVSYYTKRFFARGTQYFYKKPVIEARWDSSNKDDRGDVYYSSSLAGVNDNLNTLFLYNYVRGQLANIPSIGTDAIYVSFYSGSADNSEPTGSLKSGNLAAATATIVFDNNSAAAYDDETFTVESTDGTEVVYTLDDDTSTNTYGASTTNIGIQGGPNAIWIAGRVQDAITNSSNAHDGKISVARDSAAAATATIQFNSAIAEDYDGETFTVESTDGTEVVYTLDDDASSNTYGASTTNIGIQGMAAAASKAAELVTAAGNNSSNAHYGKITFVEGASATVALTQDTRGNAGNNSISTSDSTDITVLGFGGGTNAGPILPITGGAMQSYYTKRFFARGTQYFFKRPIIEARWDSAKRDDRGNFYYSSSLAPAEDNLNTIYLYNYVRGRLRNIPAIGSTGSIMVSLYSGSSDDSAPSGSKLILYNTTTAVTGGWKSTGIYTASIAVTAAATRAQTLYDVWWSGSGAGESLESGVTEFVTGAIKPDLDVGFKDIRDPVYYLNITNLKNKYTTQETARLNLFVRSKFWNPTIHTKANATVDNTAIISASYRVFRVLDGLEAVQYDTGSTFGTGLSYDVSGNYFDFDMGLLKGGYAYGFKFAFYDPELSSWIEQNKVFKFRVEEYEY